MDVETEEIPVGPPIDQSIDQSKMDTDFRPKKMLYIFHDLISFHTLNQENFSVYEYQTKVYLRHILD